VSSLWHAGRLLLAQSIEILSYFAAGNNPSGVFSLSSLAKTVRPGEASEVARRALRASEPRPTGVFVVELKDAADGVPSITEINAGRFPSGVTALLAAGPQNMVDVFARSAAGQSVSIAHPHAASTDLYLVRDIDALPGVVAAPRLLNNRRRPRGHRPPGLGMNEDLTYKSSRAARSGHRSLAADRRGGEP
jgi:carbamoyl-phosphate synthase large subunit